MPIVPAARRSERATAAGRDPRARAGRGVSPLRVGVRCITSHDGDEHMDEHQMMCDLIVNPYRRSPRIPGSLACSVSLHLGNRGNL